jgi:hypothetical protein
MVKVCVPGYSILGQRRVSSRCPLEKHPHSSLRGWSHPSLQEYSIMYLEYPKINTWTEANLGKFLIPLLYEGLFSMKVFSFSTKVSSLFLIYEGLPVGFIIPSLRQVSSLSPPLLSSSSTKVSSLLLYEGLFSFPSL